MTFIYNFLGMMGIMIVTSLVHELGHAVAYTAQTGRKPEIKVHWWGFSLGDLEDVKSLTLWQDFWVRYWGITFGLWAICILVMISPFLAVGVHLIYGYIFMMCFLDNVAIYQILSNWKHFKDTWSQHREGWVENDALN